MTITYDPYAPAYLDEADLREEMTRVFDLCHGCRLCFKFCTSFPTLFAAIDQHDDQDVAKLTRVEQDRVVDECFGCKLCYVNCPYTPGQHEWNLDFPRLMMRATQVRHRTEKRSVKQRLTAQALGRTDLVGTVNSALAPLANGAIGTTGGATRKLMDRVVGIAAERMLPPYARVRFSTWFKRRGATAAAKPAKSEVSVFPTCLVEYQDPGIGKDLVAVYERNEVACSLPAGAQCCGAPWLHSGDTERFVEQARKNIEVLAPEVRAGRDIVVPQPTCSYVLKQDYPDYVGGPEAELVAEHTYDSSEYLWEKVHKDDYRELDGDFAGTVPEAVTYHAPCHLRAQNIGLKSRDLMKKTGTKIQLVAECSAIDGTWGYRSENYATSRKVAAKMARAIESADNDTVVGDCHLANGGITQETGHQPLHPMQYLARAYGITEE